MKKKVLCFVVVCMLTNGLNVMALSNKGDIDASKVEMQKVYEDFKSDGKYSDSMATLYKMKSLNGFLDGTLRPDATITKAEFVKLLIASLYGDQTGCSAHWACPFIIKAKELNILMEGEITRDNVDDPITKQEVAKWSILATRGTGEVVNTEAQALNDSGVYIDQNHIDYVIEAHEKGLLNEDDIDAFDAMQMVTRAEASDIIVRIINSFNTNLN